MKKLRNKQGFTLIEVVVVMAIIAVLAILVVGAITVARNTAKETTHRSNAKTIQAGMEAYFASQKAYPATSGTKSFKAAAVDAQNVVLAGTTECPSGATPDRQGGGTVTYGGTYAYVIMPANAACGADMTTDVVNGP